MHLRTLAVDGAQRVYWLAPAAPRAPLMVVLHGSGLSGRTMAQWTGLDARGPEAGFACAFPEGRGELWDCLGAGRRDGLDDAAFIAALADALVDEGVARPGALFLAGISNGAAFAERLARHRLVAATGIALVSGSARVASHAARRRPAAPCAVLCVAGTSDPLALYAGGRAKGLAAWMARRRSRRILLDLDGNDGVAIETVADEWAAVNGCPGPAPATTLPSAPDDLPVQRVSWAAPGCRPVVLYRIVGGGHGWPGGPQYLPTRLVGKISSGFDATGAVLDFAREQLESTPLD